MLKLAMAALLFSHLGFSTSALWTAKDGINTPESVYLDQTTGRVFVSNIVGDGDKKDKKGWISLLDVSGKVVKPKWFSSGLNAPKGMRSHQGVLYVSDIDAVVAINIKDAKQKARYECKGAKFLNDVVVDSEGTVYVSDTLGSKIYSIKDGKVSVFAEGDDLESPNGLFIDGDRLVVAAWGRASDFGTKTSGHLYALDLKTKAKTLIVKDLLGNLDGLEMDTVGNYLVSDWVAGKVFQISPEGKVRELLSDMPGTADLGYVPTMHAILVPRMKENQVVAYPLDRTPQ